MPYIIQAGDRLEVRIWSSNGAQAAVNTLHYAVNGIVTGSPTLQLFADAADLALGIPFKDCISVRARYDGVQVRALVLPRPLTLQSIVSAGAGTNGANMFSPQVSGLIEWQTDFAGPGKRGRMYVPFPGTANATSDGQPDATTKGFYNTFAGAYRGFNLVDDGAGNSFGLFAVIYRPVAPPNDIDVITNHTISAGFATQKRRGAFGRKNVSPI